MVSSRTSSGRTGRPPVTSRGQILAAARRLIEADGWQRLTMRRLAAELGIGATTLYHHVRDREELLVLLVGQAIEQIERPDLPADPRARIVTVMHRSRDVLASMPWAVEVLTVDGFMGRLGDNSIWMVEVVLNAAIEAGCSKERAVEVFRHLWFYTVGEILVRARSAVAPIDRTKLLREGETRFTSRDAQALPTIAAIGDAWPEIARRDTYAEGISAFLDGLLGSSASAPTSSTPSQ